MLFTAKAIRTVWGVCLFLALNEELAKGDLGLIVLDDVMMSVDTGHRKDVCRLLAEQFTECQFVITTHDKTWAKQLRQEGVGRSPSSCRVHRLDT